jgi:molybdopterin/thiamine biosynthesis adenylyltransferase
MKERFSELDWAQIIQTKSATIVGVGGIGSWLSLLVARAEPKMLVMFDDDAVVGANLAGQMFSERQAELLIKKAAAAAENITMFSGWKKAAYYMTERITPESNPFGTSVVFAGVDSMTARHHIFNLWLKSDSSDILIDGRMGPEFFTVYTVLKNEASIAAYKSELFSEEEVPDLGCTMKATSHCGAMLAGYMFSMWTNHLTNLHWGKRIRALPWKIEINLPLMMQDLPPQPIIPQEHAVSTEQGIQVSAT